MMTARILAGLVMLAWVAGASARQGASGPEADWPQWRGPLGIGVAPKSNPPITWSETENIRWKVELPGRSHATPIIWKDRVYVLTAVQTDKEVAPPADAPPVEGAPPPRPGDGRGPGDGSQPPPRGGPSAQDAAAQERPEGQDRPRGEGQPPPGPGEGQPPPGRGDGPPSGRGGPPGGFPGRGPRRPTHIYRFSVLALDRATGKTIWEKVVKEELPHEAGHQDASQASCSPLTDGQHLYAFFGSRGLYCLTMDGQVKWEKDLGDMRTRNGFGEGSSPALHGDTLVITWDHEGDSFIVALDKNTGQEKWRKPRDESTSWATPLIVEHGGKAQVIASATNRVRSYDLATGEVLWECGGMTGNVVPTPMHRDGTVYAISGFRGAALLAIKLAEARGDITNTPAVAWKYDKDTPYVPSAVLTPERMYFVQNNNGILTCLNAKTGEKVFGPQRLDSIKGVYASLVAASDRVYLAGRNGHTVVFKDAPAYEQLADNVLDDVFNASPAIAGDELYLRGEKRLYCIARP